MQVTITELYGARTEHVSNHRTTDRAEALARAVAKAYGQGKSFHKDNGLSGMDAWYGQIGHRVRGGYSSMDTGRVSVRFE